MLGLTIFKICVYIHQTKHIKMLFVMEESGRPILNRSSHLNFPLNTFSTMKIILFFFVFLKSFVLITSIMVFNKILFHNFQYPTRIYSLILDKFKIISNCIKKHNDMITNVCFQDNILPSFQVHLLHP